MAKDTLKAKYNLTKAQLTTLINALNVLKKLARAGKVDEPGLGICANWKIEVLREDLELASYPYPLVMDLAADWPGSAVPGIQCAFPVPHNFPYWTGLALDARLDLMDYITKRLRDWRRRTPA